MKTKVWVGDQLSHLRKQNPKIHFKDFADSDMKSIESDLDNYLVGNSLEVSYKISKIVIL